MTIEVRIPEDLWSFVGTQLRSRGYISQDLLVSAIVEEPKLKWFLLDCREWQDYRSFSDLKDLNPIEHSEETQKELSETENTHAIFVKETLKEFPENETIFKELGFADSDYVVFMSADRTKEVFDKTDATTLLGLGKAFYYGARAQVCPEQNILSRFSYGFYVASIHPRFFGWLVGWIKLYRCCCAYT